MLLALIKADFYQMRSRKSPWVTLTLIVLLTACATWIAIDFTKQTEPTLFQNIANFILFNFRALEQRHPNQSEDCDIQQGDNPGPVEIQLEVV